MIKLLRIGTAMAAAGAVTGLLATAAMAGSHFGTDDDAAYAAKVWKSMVKQHLAGPGSVITLPYEGTDPHGMLLETYFAKATIDGHTGDLIVKRNYGPADVEVDQVLANPSKHLGAITIMFRREAGYDEDNQNWFWVKFLPDGSLDKNPKGMRLAGRVAKGADKGCIACHQGADGGDYLFGTNAIKN